MAWNDHHEPGVQDYIGRIATDLKADIMVVRARDAEANRSLLNSHVEDVQIVLVGGKVLYGDTAAVDTIRPGQCEAILIHGAKKDLRAGSDRSQGQEGANSLRYHAEAASGFSGVGTAGAVIAIYKHDFRRHSRETCSANNA
jgi:hypothetical protein